MPAYRLQNIGPYRFHRGGEVPEVSLAYETWGALNHARSNVVLLTTGLSPGCHAHSTLLDPSPGWWEGMIGPGRALDTDRYFVICNNSVGSCHGSTGPASVDPRTGSRYRMSFPELSVEDIAATSRLLLQSLGVTKLAAVVGSSLGGMTSLAYAAMFPHEVDKLVTISAAASASTFAIALRSIQREAIRTDPAWLDGSYPLDKPPLVGMALARKLGLVSYRSPGEWGLRFKRDRVEKPKAHGIEFEIEAYLEHQASRFIHTFDANCYLYLSRAMDLFSLESHAETPEEAYARVGARRTLVVGVETDILFPVEQQLDLANRLRAAGKNVHLARLSSLQGHDSFLIDLDRFSPVIGSFLEEG